MPLVELLFLLLLLLRRALVNRGRRPHQRMRLYWLAILRAHLPVIGLWLPIRLWRWTIF
jgi:hypothetical protein